jgi:FkbM family methyltransferase
VKHAILFEPNPRLVERAQENLRLNGLKFDVIAAALSDQAGSIEFENATTDASCNRIVDGFTTSKATISVPRTTFDQFVRELRSEIPPVSGVKIDVEGHENSVLRGMQGFLRKQRPKLVMFEYLARTDIAQTLALFREAGYAVFEITPAGPRIATEMVAPLQDLFACPDELSRDFGAVGSQ